MQDRQADLERRIVRLERRNRWLTASCMVLAAAPLMLAFGVPKTPTTNVPLTPNTPSPIGEKPVINIPAPEVSESLTTRKLTIVDDKGRPVVILQAAVNNGEITVNQGGDAWTRITGAGLSQRVWKTDRFVETTSLASGKLTLYTGTAANAGKLVIAEGSKTLTQIEASRVAVHDAAGAQRGSLGASGTSSWRATLELGDSHTGRVGLGASNDSAGVQFTPGPDSIWKFTAGATKQYGGYFETAAPSAAGKQHVKFPVSAAPQGLSLDPRTKDYLLRLYPNP